MMADTVQYIALVMTAAGMISHMCDLHDGRYTVQYIALDMTAACMMYTHLYTLHVVVVATGAEAAVVVTAGRALLANGSRFPGIWLVAFQGGTFERLAQRCSGDFSQCQQSKYVAQLPGLPENACPVCIPALSNDCLNHHNTCFASGCDSVMRCGYMS